MNAATAVQEPRKFSDPTLQRIADLQTKHFLDFPEIHPGVEKWSVIRAKFAVQVRVRELKDELVRFIVEHSCRYVGAATLDKAEQILAGEEIYQLLRDIETHSTKVIGKSTEPSRFHSDKEYIA